MHHLTIKISYKNFNYLYYKQIVFNKIELPINLNNLELLLMGNSIRTRENTMR